MLQVNRTNIPWVVVNFHNPWYSTDGYGWKQYDQMRVSMEEMTHQFGVDAFFCKHRLLICLILAMWAACARLHACNCHAQTCLGS